jgi:hypothetical protein
MMTNESAANRDTNGTWREFIAFLTRFSAMRQKGTDAA